MLFSAPNSWSDTFIFFVLNVTQMKCELCKKDDVYIVVFKIVLLFLRFNYYGFQFGTGPDIEFLVD